MRLGALNCWDSDPTFNNVRDPYENRKNQHHTWSNKPLKEGPLSH